MADETDTPVSDINPTEERIKDLSGKVKTIAQERDDALKAKSDAEARMAEADRRAAFSDGFADIVSKNPNAQEYKADIQAKVMTGYTVQDATFAVLGGAGKLGVQAPAQPIPAGGSASTTIPQGGNKAVGEMSLAEKREKLSEEIMWN